MNHEFQLQDTIAKAKSVLSDFDLTKVRIAYSGGSDSEVVQYLINQELGFNIISVFYDTGIEWQATKDHVSSRPFEIDKINALMPVPTSNKKYGHPFINKRVSNNLQRLQKHHFNFQGDGAKPFEQLYKKYPRCKAALRWWCNDFGKITKFNIANNPYLKEFLIEYGLPFNVSEKCCDGAKKRPFAKYAKENDISLVINGMRKSEGGARSGAYKSCFFPKGKYSYGIYMPLFFWKNDIKQWYIDTRNIQLSKCYTNYGLNRTGCAGCPFGLKFEDELIQLEINEPKLAKGINNIFAPTYEWTRRYREFQKEMKQKVLDKS